MREADSKYSTIKHHRCQIIQCGSDYLGANWEGHIHFGLRKWRRGCFSGASEKFQAEESRQFLQVARPINMLQNTLLGAVSPVLPFTTFGGREVLKEDRQLLKRDNCKTSSVCNPPKGIRVMSSSDTKKEESLATILPSRAVFFFYPH